MLAGNLKGLGKLSRSRLAAVVRATKGPVSVLDVATTLGINAQAAALQLSRWAAAGWMGRLRRGLYQPMAIEADSALPAPDDPWVVADRLYRPCYIGGWSASNYWDLTEQIFRTTIVISTKRPRKVRQSFAGMDFLVRVIKPEQVFGLRPVWRGSARVQVSDPARTIIDMIALPALAGGLQTLSEMFQAYLKRKDVNIDQLVNYATRIGNGAILKRLGYFIERYSPESRDAAAACLKLLTSGNAKLDPDQVCPRLMTRWRLWVPERWATLEAIND
jgi:predicted transcriptional regulator of viral defense system